MCQAMSLLVTKSNKVYWKLGVDSHDVLHDMYRKKDVELTDDKDAPHNTFARIEIVPKNNDYLKPDKWVYQIDERVKPNWITRAHKDTALKAHAEWKEKLYSGIAIDQMPEHPFKIKAPEITKKHIKLVKEWDSVRGSVWDSVWDNVRGSVRDSVRGSVRDNVYAQIGPVFPKIKKYKYTNGKAFKNIKGYPFQSAVKLWRMGLVPVYYENKWHLYGSPKGNNKIEELWKEEV